MNKDELYLPAPVIRSLGRYLQTGATVKRVEEVFEGRNIVRYIANDNLILWSGELDQEDSDD